MQTDQPDDYDFLYKIILVGDAGVGKTHILSRFTKGTLPRTVQATIGVEFATSTLALKSGGRVKAQFWDTAGQERYRSITRAHYRRAVGALLVYDVTSEITFANIKRWVDDLRDHAEPDIVIMLVGNKTDLGNKQVPRETAQQFAVKHGLLFTEVSAVSSTGIQEAFQALLEANHQNLLEFVDLPRVECLNLHPGFPVVNALVQKNDEVYYIRSDEASDPQIIMTFPFRQAVKLHHLCIRANLDPSAPVIVKLYINQTALSFSDTESVTPVQELALTDVDYIRGTVALRFVKFQRVTSLTLFVERNRGGDFSRINGLEFFGSPVQDMNMKELKSSG